VKSSSLTPNEGDNMWTHRPFQELRAAGLGVTLVNDFAVTEHVQELTTKSSQRPCTLYVYYGRSGWRCIPGGLSVGSRCQTARCKCMAQIHEGIRPTMN